MIERMRMKYVIKNQEMQTVDHTDDSWNRNSRACGDGESIVVQKAVQMARSFQEDSGHSGIAIMEEMFVCNKNFAWARLFSGLYDRW